jgi:hypothetical protein
VLPAWLRRSARWTFTLGLSLALLAAAWRLPVSLTQAVAVEPLVSLLRALAFFHPNENEERASREIRAVAPNAVVLARELLS